MKGRKPMPSRLKVLLGNPGKRPLPTGVPEPQEGAPEAPGWLSGYAQEEWHARAPGLCRMRVLGKDDMMALAAYCQAVGDVRLAREQLKEIEARNPRGVLVMKVESRDGDKLRRNILYVIAKESTLDAIRYAAELGLTPAARERVSALPETGGKDGIRKLMYVEKKAE